ncbi:MAG: translocation/assembly module TamB domain-containing protein, partial [Prochlorococcaceae cyanobacterium]
SALLRLAPLGPDGAAAGTLQLRGGGNWRSNHWQAQLSSRNLDLTWPADLLALGGELDGRVDGELQLAWRDGEPDCQGDLLLRQLSWRPQPDQPSLSLERPLLRCQGRDLSLPSSTWRWAERSGQVGLRARWQPGALLLEQVQLSSGRSWLWARGALTPNPVLAGEWQLDPADLPLPEGLDPDLVGSQLRGSLELAGSWSEPLLSTRVSQASNTLLGPWQAQLRWRDQRLLLDRFASEHLRGQGSLPITLAGGEGLRTGLLDLRLQLQRYPLTRLGPLLGAELQGLADADGTIRGPLSGLTPDFLLRLEQPGVGPLLVAETWEGNWLGDPAGGGRLRMASRGEAPPGRLEARLDRRWVPVAVSLERNDGRLDLEGSPRAYRWTASDFPLQGLQLALGPEGQWRPLRGGLSGAGVLELQPLAFQGRVELDQPSLLGVPARRVALEGSYRDRRYQATGEITAEGGGDLDLEWSGIWRGDYVARLRGRDLDDGLVRRLLEAWPLWRGDPGIDPGSAADLGTLMIDTMGGSIDDLLVALNRAHERLRQALADQRERLTPAQRLEGLTARFDLDLELSGPRLADTRVDGTVEGHLWFPGQDRDQALGGDPIRLELNGPVRVGSGSFGFSGVPLSLVALFTPVPDELRGRVSAQGSYTLAAEPELALELALEDAALGDTELALRRGSVQLAGNAIALDLALRAAGADSGIDLAGVVPLDPAEEGIELRATSRDDGLIVLSRLAQPTLVWEEGSADLQLLVRGSLDRPIANGFLRIQNGELALLDQEVEDLQATVLFDFEQLLLQEFTARVGGEGRISGSGSLGLFSPQLGGEGDPARLRLALEGLPYRSPRLQTDVDGELTVGGSLTALQLGGELALAKGSLNVQPGRLAGEENGLQPTASVQELAEQNWDFQQPLVLLGPELETRNGEDLRALVPAVGFLGFDGLRISLGEDFNVMVPQLADFRTSGTLRLDGPLGPDIEARGVVKLERGRLNLFTTNFFLDRNAPNVAVFTP